jgi:hypothetical protein
MKPGVHSFPNQTRTQQQQKRELQANLFNEHGCKSPQYNTGKLNSTTYQKDHAAGSSRFYPRDVGMVQHMQIFKIYRDLITLSW